MSVSSSKPHSEKVTFGVKQILDLACSVQVTATTKPRPSSGPEWLLLSRVVSFIDILNDNLKVSIVLSCYMQIITHANDFTRCLDKLFMQPSLATMLISPSGSALDLLTLHVSSQARGRSSCGSSCWSSWPTATTLASSPGRAPTASSRWPTRMRWPSAGASARASPTWTMTSSVVLCATTMTRTSWPRCMASAMPTNLTSRASRRRTRTTQRRVGLLSTRLRCLTSSPTTATSPKWTSWAAILRLCPSPQATFLALRQHTGTHPTAPSILGHPWPDILLLTPTWARTTEDVSVTPEQDDTGEKPKCAPTQGTWAEPCLKGRWYDANVHFLKDMTVFSVAHSFSTMDKPWWLYSSKGFMDIPAAHCINGYAS